MTRCCALANSSTIAAQKAGRAGSWPTHVTEQASARGVNATPTTLVQGVPVPADAHTIAAAVAAATG
jgi:hypothetical protein